MKLEKLGYKNFYKILNAKDYGIPQNRERIFVVSILGEHQPYEFPEKKELKLRLRDLFDNEVPENYYLKDVKIQEKLTFCHVRRAVSRSLKSSGVKVCAQTLPDGPLRRQTANEAKAPI